MKNNIIYTFLITLLVVTLGSCRKAIPPGPQGEQGDKGEKGIKGEVGDKGDKGDGGGIGNVSYSDWAFLNFTLNSGQSNPAQGIYFYNGRIYDDAITQEILNQGNVIVYFKRDGKVFKLDYLTDDESLTQRLAPGQVWLYSSWDASNTMFRYIIIPASSKVGIQAISGGETTYEFLAKKFKIVD